MPSGITSADFIKYNIDNSSDPISGQGDWHEFLDDLGQIKLDTFDVERKVRQDLKKSLKRDLLSEDENFVESATDIITGIRNEIGEVLGSSEETSAERLQKLKQSVGKLQNGNSVLEIHKRFIKGKGRINANLYYQEMKGAPWENGKHDGMSWQMIGANEALFLTQKQIQENITEYVREGLGGNRKIQEAFQNDSQIGGKIKLVSNLLHAERFHILSIADPAQQKKAAEVFRQQGELMLRMIMFEFVRQHTTETQTNIVRISTLLKDKRNWKGLGISDSKYHEYHSILRAANTLPLGISEQQHLLALVNAVLFQGKNIEKDFAHLAESRNIDEHQYAGTMFAFRIIAMDIKRKLEKKGITTDQIIRSSPRLHDISERVAMAQGDSGGALEMADRQESIRLSEDETTYRFSLSDSIRTAVNDTKTNILLGSGISGSKYDVQQLRLLGQAVRGEMPADPASQKMLRIFVKDILKFENRAVLDKRILTDNNTIAGKKEREKGLVVNTILGKYKKENILLQMAAIELAEKVQGKNKEDSHWKKLEQETRDAVGHTFQNKEVMVEHDLENANSLLGKITTWRGMALIVGVKYGAILTILFNLMASVQSGDFANPYLFGGGAALYGAIKAFQGNYMFRMFEKGTKQYYDSGEIFDHLRLGDPSERRVLDVLTGSNKKEFALLKNVDLSRAGRKRFNTIRDRKKKGEEARVKLINADVKAKGGGKQKTDSRQYHQVSPEDMKEMAITGGKESMDAIIATGGINDTPAQNQERYRVLEILYKWNISGAELEAFAATLKEIARVKKAY